MSHLRLFAVAALLTAAFSAQGADLVVIGNPAAAALSKDDIADVYLGKNQSVTPLDLPESAPLRAEFYKKATGRDLAQVKATWSRLIFSGKAQPPKEMADPGAMKKAVAADAKAIGYIEKAAVDGSVKVLTVLD